MEQIGATIRRIVEGRVPDKRIHISVPDARVRLHNALKYFCGEKAVWLPEYEEVAKWLENSKGKGLLLLGSNGRGKSLLATKIFPFFFREQKLWYEVVSAYEINDKYKNLHNTKIFCIDDVGVESIANSYGEKKHVFSMVMDEVERMQKLIVITTNLSQEMLLEKYSSRTVDRITGCCKVVVFNGSSLRGR